MNNLELLQELLNPLAIQKELSRRSFYEFFKVAWNILEPETKLEDNWHIKYLCDLLQEEVERISRGEPKTKDIIINIPPRTLKSRIITVTLNAWAWISYPSMKFITASYSNELSVEHATETRRLIESDWYRQLFGDSFEMTTDQNVKSRFQNNKSGYRRATSVGGTVTGQGADIIIADDPHKAEEALSELSRDKVYSWWTKTMFTRLNDQRTGLRIVVMQRLHEDDLTGKLIKNPDYKHICIPAKKTKDVKPTELGEYYHNDLMFHARFDDKVLEAVKSNMGSRDFAGQYLQTPAPSDGDIIKEGWYQWFDKKEIPEVVVNLYTDSAYGKEESDNSATIAYGVHNKNIYVFGVFAWNLGFPEFIKRYRDMVNANGYTNDSRCYFEPKASGISMVQQLKQEGGLNIIEDKPPTESKVSRVSSASASIEAGRVFLLKDGVGVEQLLSESVMFPNGSKDDCIDTLASIIRIEIISKRNTEFGVLNYM